MRDIVTSENRADYMAKKLGLEKDKKESYKEDKVHGEMPKTHKKGKEMDIGEGRYLHRHGHDANGNSSVWVSQGSGRARKIQMHNLPTVHKTMPQLTQAGIREIHDYANKYHDKEES